MNGLFVSWKIWSGGGKIYQNYWEKSAMASPLVSLPVPPPPACLFCVVVVVGTIGIFLCLELFSVSIIRSGIMFACLSHLFDCGDGNLTSLLAPFPGPCRKHVLGERAQLVLLSKVIESVLPYLHWTSEV